MSAQFVPEPTPPTKWMSEVNKMVECKYPGCGGATKPPNIFCSWMCEVDFNKLHAQKPVRDKWGKTGAVLSAGPPMVVECPDCGAPAPERCRDGCPGAS